MFVFDNALDKDARSYGYELYEANQVSGLYPNISPIANATVYSAGTSGANVFTITVVNSTDSLAKRYYGRVRTIDSSGNPSSWSPIVQSDQENPLISNQYIANLTASKITAGTIGAHTIALAGATSIIKSLNFDGTDVGNGSYANATTGWLINGQGRAYFYDATIVGSIDIGGFDSGSFHVDIDGNMWLGAGVFANGTFRVTKEGDAYANSLTTNDLSLKGNTTIGNNGKIFLGAGNYNNSDTPFYVDDTSQFSLGTKLTWDGSALTVQGTLKFPDGSEPIDEDDAEDAAENVITSGFVGGLTISSSKMYYGAGSFASSDTGFYVAKNGGTTNFSLGNKLYWDGSALTVQGTLKFPDGSEPGTFDDGDALTGGSIGGLTINSNKIYFGSGTHNNESTKFYVDNTGKFSLGNKFSWDGNALSITGNVVITTGSINIGGGKFTVNSDGVINSADGQIAGWTLGPHGFAGSGGSKMNVSGDAEFSQLRITGLLETTSDAGTNVGGNGIMYTNSNPNRMRLDWQSPNLYAWVDGVQIVLIGSASDRRLKENISDPLRLGDYWLDKIFNKIKIWEYVPYDLFNEDFTDIRVRLGVMADEMVDVFPELVAWTDPSKGEDVYSAVDYSGLTPILTLAIQNLNNRLKTLEEKVKNLI